MMWSARCSRGTWGRLNDFMWWAATGALKTGQVIWAYNILGTRAHCVFCTPPTIESSAHLFTECPALSDHRQRLLDCLSARGHLSRAGPAFLLFSTNISNKGSRYLMARFNNIIWSALIECCLTMSHWPRLNSTSQLVSAMSWDLWAQLLTPANDILLVTESAACANPYLLTFFHSFVCFPARQFCGQVLASSQARLIISVGSNLAWVIEFCMSVGMPLSFIGLASTLWWSGSICQYIARPVAWC